MATKFKWASEADMCEEFIQQYTTAGWICHPETFEFDIVLVSAEGQRVGVEAKLRANMDVLYQAITRSNANVHFRAVLVPEAPRDFCRIATGLKLGVVAMPNPAYRLFWGAPGAMQEYNALCDERLRWSQNVTGALLERPVRMRAGGAAPRQVTRWKVQAVTFCMNYRGKHFTRAEFDLFAKVNFDNWVRNGWVEEVGFATVGGKRVKMWQLTEQSECPDFKYPELVEALRPVDREIRA